MTHQHHQPCHRPHKKPVKFFWCCARHSFAIFRRKNFQSQAMYLFSKNLSYGYLIDVISTRITWAVIEQWVTNLRGMVTSSLQIPLLKDTQIAPERRFSPVFLQKIKLFQVSKSYQSKFSSVRAKIGSISKKACHNFETLSKSNVTGSRITNVLWWPSRELKLDAA